MSCRANTSKQRTFFTTTMDDPTDPTSKFRDALPYAVLRVAPALAALHSTKGRGEEWCFKCGSYLLSGNAEIQVTRMKKRKRAMPLTRFIRKTCRCCGWSNDTPIAAQPSPSVSRIPSVNVESQPIKTLPISTALPVTPPIQNQPTLSSTHLSPAQPKLRSKKKTSLQEMLSRNRQKTEQAQQNGEGQVPGGLAAFLSGL